MEKKKKATKKSFEKALYDYIKKLDREEQYNVAIGMWHIWNASRIYNQDRYGAVKRHADISDIALIAHNAYVHDEKEGSK